MVNKVLVTYASKYGATAEIAEKIGQVLGENDCLADVLPVKQVKDITPPFGRRAWSALID